MGFLEVALSPEMDSTEEEPVWNTTILLRADKKKGPALRPPCRVHGRVWTRFSAAWVGYEALRHLP